MVQVVSPQKPMGATCHKCKAGLEYVYTEIQEKRECDYTGDCEMVKYITCPCCNNQVRVKGYHS